MIMLEPKGINPFQVPNRLKIMMAANEDWVVPATKDERRFFVLDISDHRRGDFEYFDALAKAVQGEELAAFLDFMLKYDLGKFNVRKVPHTDALNEQKLLSLDTAEGFWYECLCEGCVVGSDNHAWQDDQFVATQFLYDCY